MKKKAAITMLALGMLIFLGAQPQMPHLEALDGPYNAQNMIDMALCRYGPTDPPVIYGVNADTCLTKTTNRGDSWIILPQGHIYKSGVRCVAVHPTDPDIVYKAEWGSIYQKGIMRSTDGGYFWTLINNGLPDYLIPSKLGIFNQYPDTILLGMNIDQQEGSSLYRTTNGGSDWLPVIQWGSDFLNITDFSFHPDPLLARIVCLSAKQSSDPGNAYRGIWKSTDFGVTWEHIGRPDNMEHAEITCVAMVDENIIYAGYWTGITEQAIGGVEITTDGGVTWSVLSPTLEAPAKDIVFDTSNPGTFYVAFGAGEGDEGNGIIKFENYGASWSYYNNGLTDKFVNVLTNDNTELYAGTGKGFYYTESADANYVWTEKVNGLLKGWVDYVYPYPNKVISFARNCRFVSYLVNSTDNGVSWNTINTFNSRTCAAAVRPDYNDEMLRGYGPNYSLYIRPVLAKSVDGGVVWDTIRYWSGMYYATMQVIRYAPTWSRRVYIGIGDWWTCPLVYMLRSNDAGSSFEELFDPMRYDVRSLAVENNPDYLYLGDCNPENPKGVHKSTNAGNSWTAFNDGFPLPLPIINELAIDPNNIYIYAATDHGLWKRSADGSTIWQRVGEDVISESEIVALVINPSETNIIYCATEDENGIGHIYTSPDYGNIWLETPIDWPISGEKKINDLAIDANAPDTVYAGTSQGVYKYVDNYISGPISQNTILSGDWIVTGDITISSNITLTLQPGTELYSVPNFDWLNSGADRNRCEIIINGTLQAAGTETNPIKFTSLATNPQPRDWYGIRILTNGQTYCDYAHILYGYAGVTATSAQNLNITFGLIQNNSQYGLKLSGTSVSIKDNTIDNNGAYGIWTNSCAGSIERNTITRHSGYGIWIKGSTDISGNIINNEGFSGRSQYGIQFVTGFYNQTMSQNTIKGFGQGGILLRANNSVNINNCSITDNAYYGIKRLRGYGYDKVRDSEILEHETGIYCIDHPAGGMDLGRTPFDMGNNSIYSTGASDWLYVANLGEQSEPAVIYAEYNWWGSDPPDPSKFIGPVNYDPWLSGPPSGGGPQSSGETGLNQCSKITRITPNPISRETTIYLSITQPDNIELMIYNICGQRVKNIANRINEPGTYKVSWDGKDEQGDILAAGVYFVQLKTNAGISSSCKIMLIR
jgi:photosystem II stability/assembly factor-like uncharacterized protein